MHNAENPTVIDNPQAMVDPAERQRREKAYLKTIGKLPPDSRDLVFLLESSMNEEDFHNKYKFHIGRRRALQRSLTSLGLNNQGVRTVMNYFNLPYEGPKIGRR